MDWDQLATVSQLVTGLGTLAVAVFLWKQLKVQHRDSERDFAFANENRLQNLTMGIYGDESTSEVYWNACTAWDSLAPAEVNRFRFLQTLNYLNVWNSWRLKRDAESLERFRLQWRTLLENPGQRRFHERWGRDLVERDPSLFAFVEQIYDELEAQAP